MKTICREVVKELVNQIFGLAYEISTDERNTIDVMVEYAGHINAIDIRIYNEGALNQNRSTVSETFYLDDNSIERTISYLHIVVDKLEEIKKSEQLNINYSNFVLYERQIYSFTGINAYSQED